MMREQHPDAELVAIDSAFRQSFQYVTRVSGTHDTQAFDPHPGLSLLAGGVSGIAYA